MLCGHIAILYAILYPVYERKKWTIKRVKALCKIFLVTKKTLIADKFAEISWICNNLIPVCKAAPVKCCSYYFFKKKSFTITKMKLNRKCFFKSTKKPASCSRGKYATSWLHSSGIDPVPCMHCGKQSWAWEINILQVFCFDDFQSPWKPNYGTIKVTVCSLS